MVFLLFQENQLRIWIYKTFWKFIRIMKRLFWSDIQKFLAILKYDYETFILARTEKIFEIFNFNSEFWEILARNRNYKHIYCISLCFFHTYLGIFEDFLCKFLS